MADIRITPASSIMAFTSSLNFIETLTQGASGSVVLYGSGSTGRTNLFAIDGNNGRLFSVDDDLSDSLFSVNTIAGLPVIEAFANNTVNIGKYGAYSFVATGSGDARIGSGSVMFVTSSGRVGIGTTTPISSLDVSGLSIFRNPAGTNYNENIRLPESTGGYASIVMGGGYNASGTSTGQWTLVRFPNSSNNLFTIRHNATDVMSFTTSSNVGIGYTAPLGKLSVAGATYINTNTNLSGLTSPKLTVLQTAGTADWAVGIKGGTGTGGSYGMRIDGGTNSSDYNILLLNSAATLTYFAVRGDGYVGIGTSSPNSLLHVNGADPFVRINNTSADVHGIKISYSNSDTHGLHLTYTANSATASIDNTYPATAGQPYGDIYFRQNIGGTMTNVMVIQADGSNVLIGYTSGNSNKLQVSGSIFTGVIASTPTTPTNGTVLYSEDIAGSAELKVIDEAGNITTLSPHNFSLIPEGPSEELAWSYYSEKEGKKINVDMLKLARTLEKLTGEKLVYIE